MPDGEDRDEAYVQTVADGIRRMIEGPNSAEDVDQVVGAAMGDEQAEQAEDNTPSPAE